MNYLDLDIPERKGIYLFLLPDLKVGYVGSTKDLKRRYEQHIKGLGNKVIRSEIIKENVVEYLILEYCDNYHNKDLKLIESAWIKYYKSKGLKLINVSNPEKEMAYEEPQALYQFDLEGNFIREYKSICEAAKLNKANHALISNCLHGRNYTGKGYIWILKDTFSENKLRKCLEENNKKIERKKESNSHLKKEVVSFDFEGNILEIFPSVKSAERIYNTSVCNAIKKAEACKNKLWAYNTEDLESKIESLIQEYKNKKEAYKIHCINFGKNSKTRNARAVNQYALNGMFIKRWNSITDASKNLGIAASNVSSHIKGNYKHVGGYLWKYAEESELENESVRL